jgi:NAD(P)-dependent dehydrogenase (short-subunit alcohol dehydrogenase family)
VEATVTQDTTTGEVLAGMDLSGLTVAVTGGSSGLGEETSRALSAAGAHVVMAVRDLLKGQAAVARIRDRHPDASLELHELDLGSLASARDSGDALVAKHPRIDRLINNAGVMAPPLRYTSDGFELQIGTNHLGHFLWTAHVLPALLAAAPGARIVNLSSRGHVRGTMDWEDPHYRHGREYDKWSAYGQSKTANIWFTTELDRRFRDRGIRAYAVHPGVIMTELSRHVQQSDLEELASRMPAGGMTLKSVEAGAATQVWAATAVELNDVGGGYLEDVGIAGPATDTPPTRGYVAHAMDEESARRLWQWSEEQVGEPFPT